MTNTTTKGALFDVDGTLCDTNYLHVVAWSRALRDAGEDASMAVIHRHMGIGGDRFTTEILGHHSDKATEAHSRHYQSMWNEVRAFPDAAALLRRCASVGRKPVLASSAGEDELEILRKTINADDVIATATSSSDASSSKPSPDIFSAALERSQLKAEDSVVIGDTVWDIYAARDAGIRCIGVLSGGFSAAELQDAGAIAVYSDASHLLKEFDASPLA